MTGFELFLVILGAARATSALFRVVDYIERG